MNGDGPPAPPAWLHDVLRAPAELAPALHAVLGGELESVVVDSPAFALRAIEILKRDGGGRLTFVQEPDVPVAPHASIEAPGVAGRLVDLIEVEPRFRPLAESVLGHVIVADDLNAAMAASNLNGRGTLFVTREGDVLNPGRMIAGGSMMDGAAAMRAADAMAREAAERELAAAEEDYRAAAARLAEHQSSRETAAQAVSAAVSRARNCERLLAEHRDATVNAERAIALAQAEATNHRRRLGEIAEAIVGSNARLEELALSEQDGRSRLAAVREEFNQRRSGADRLTTAVAEAAAHVEARKEQIAAMQRDLRYAIETANQIDAQIGEHQAGLERSRTERADFERELNSIAQQHEAARVRETELTDAAQRLREECQERDRHLEAARATLGEIREILQKLETESMESNLARERARTLSDELARSFREKFEADFDAVAAEIVPALDGRDAPADDTRVVDLRTRLERIGEVNLAADSEVKELEERAQTLSTERADLTGPCRT